MRLLGLCILQQNSGDNREPSVSYLIQEMEKYCVSVYQYDCGKNLQNGYQEALKSVSRDVNLCEYDKVCLFSSELFGPLTDMAKVFEELTKDTCIGGLVPEQKDGMLYLQEEFLVLDTKWLLTEAIWHTVTETEDWLIELCQKYNWKSLISGETLNKSKDGDFPYDMFLTDGLLTKGLPFLRKKLFDISYDKYLHYSAGEALKQAIAYIEEQTTYPVSYIYQSLLKSYYLSDLKELLQWNYVLPETENTSVDTRKVAVIVHMYYMELLPQMVEYLLHIPPEIDIYITVGDEQKKNRIEEVCTVIKNRVEVRLVNNRGRDLSALLVGCRDIVEKYEYVCFTHDKRSLGNDGPVTSASSFMNSIWENTISSEGYIYSVLNRFASEPNLGIMAPPAPLHHIYFYSIGREWTVCYPEAEKIMNRLQLHCPMSEEKQPYVLGSAFWFRTGALRPLFTAGFTCEDFPAEPMPMDGTFSHGLERVISYVAQSQGYYSSWIMTANYARSEIGNLNQMLHGIVTEEQRKLAPAMEMYYCNLKERINRNHKVYLYVDTGEGFKQSDVSEAFMEINRDGSFSVDFSLKKWKNVDKVRFISSISETKMCSFTQVEIDGQSILPMDTELTEEDILQDAYEWKVNGREGKHFRICGYLRNISIEEKEEAKVQQLFIYVDTGKGFSEEQKLERKVWVDGKGNFRLVMSNLNYKEAVCIRFDWKTICNSEIQYEKILINGKNLWMESRTGYQKNENTFIEEGEPTHICVLENQLERIEIYGHIGEHHRLVDTKKSCKIYLDYGDGYREEDSVDGWQYQSEDGRLCVNGCILDAREVKRLLVRIPMGERSLVTWNQVSIGGFREIPDSVNGIRVDNAHFIEEEQAEYEFYLNRKIDNVYLEGNIQSVPEYLQEMLEKYLLTISLYFDYGFGYNEECRKMRKIMTGTNHRFELSVCAPRPAGRVLVRFEQDTVLLSKPCFHMDNRIREYKTENVVLLRDGSYYAEKGMAHYEFYPTEAIENVRIEGSAYGVNADEAKSMEDKLVMAAVYMDYGEGFSEAHVIRKKLMLGERGEYRLQIQIPVEMQANIRQMRIDPINEVGKRYRISKMKVYLNKRRAYIYKKNGIFGIFLKRPKFWVKNYNENMLQTIEVVGNIKR